MEAQRRRCIRLRCGLAPGVLSGYRRFCRLRCQHESWPPTQFPFIMHANLLRRSAIRMAIYQVRCFLKRESEGEFEKFNALARKILSVPHEEIQEREKQYQQKRAKLKKKKPKGA